MGNFTKDLETLRVWRENNDRKSREIMDIWLRSVERNIHSLGKEKHVILEQVGIAALDCYQLRIAETCFDYLHNEFPNSTRVQLLEAMHLEAEEKYDEALRVINSVIKRDETNSEAKKRKIAILKAQNKIPEAIKELTEYLKIYMADNEAWQELSELYIGEHEFNKAAFCVEELLLHNPHNHLLHQRYAEIKYSQGGFDNIETAKSYYCQALKLNLNNMRALYGVYLCATSILTSTKCSAQKKKEYSKVTEWTLKEIENQYKANSSISDIEERLAALEV